ncbi:DUF4440 domain-containing protein [Stenotrophomonas sp. LGBM10]|uniref:DUF4440 domain-containing protein n=1 Tax=Stenotrophomonas sp. LGBM10 TaxID=3390038 RepID=UPI00398B4E62
MNDIPPSSLAAFDEVRALHVLIEDWFNARLPADALEALLARFTDDFSMVGIGGVRLDKPTLARFFAAAHGGRVGLRIAVDDLAFLPLPGNACAVRYREDQADAQGSTRREALAVLRADTGGALRWQALHETSVGG